MVSGLLSFESFLNYLNPWGNEGTCGGRHWYFWSPEVFLSWFGIVSFIGGNVASDFIFLFFLGMCLYGVTLALVYPVNPELTDRSVQGFSAAITYGSGASGWVVNFG